MATYYVSRTGNDSTGDGSSGSPWKTINKAVATVPAGTTNSPNTIIVKNGNYDMVAGEGISATAQGVTIDKANLIVKAETREGVVLRGNWTPALLRGPNGYPIPCDCGPEKNAQGCGTAWDVTTPFTLPDAKNYFGKGQIFDISAANVTIDGFVIECVAAEGIRWSRGNGARIQYNVIYFCLEMGINVISADAGQFGNENKFGSDINVLYNKIFVPCTGRLSPAWVCSHQGGAKNRPDAAGGGALQYGSVWGPGLIKGNVVGYCFGEGFDIGRRAWGTPDNPIIVEDNIVHDTRHVQFYMLHCRHMHFRNNFSYATVGHPVFSLKPKHGGNAFAIRDEVVDTPTGALPPSENCFFYNNVGVNTDSLVNIGNSLTKAGVPVPKTNIYVGFNTLVSGDHTDNMIRLGSNNTGIFENNIVHHANARANVPMTSSPGTFTIRGNAYTQNPTGNYANRPGNVVNANVLPASAMTDLVSTGWAGSNFGFWTTYADFAANVRDNFVAANYHIASTSPAKDAAVAAAPNGSNFSPPPYPRQQDYRRFGRTAPDMGFYEFGGTTAPSYQAAFSRNPTALALDTGTAVAFTNQSSYVNTELTGYLWTVKKSGVTQTTATTVNFNYTFASAGSYTVELRITTGAGNDTATASYTISDPAPTPSVTAAFTAQPPQTTVAKGTTIRFTDQSVIHNATFVSRQWLVKTNPGNVTQATATTAVYDYTFATAGTFDVVLTETASGGISDTETVTIVVTDPVVPAVTANFTYSDPDLTVTAGSSITFTNASAATNCNITGYTWGIDRVGGSDSENFTTTNLTYTFRTAGQWLVSLRVDTDAAVADVKFVTVTVQAAAPTGDADFMVVPVLFTAATSTGTQTVTAAALGTIVPKGVHLKLVGGTTPGTAANNAVWGEGAASAASQWAFARFSENGTAAAVAKKRQATTACLMTIDNAGAVTGLASFIQFVAGGVELDVTDAFPSGWQVEATFYAGTDCQFYAGSATVGAGGTETTIETGFETDCAYIASPWATSDDSAQNDAEFSRGWALATGPQMAFRNEDMHGRDPTLVVTRHHGARVGTSGDGTPGTYVGLSAANWTPTGFGVQVVNNGLNRALFTFAFATGGARLQLTTETLSTGASSSHAIAFEAQTVMALTSSMRTEETQLSTQEAAAAGWYCASIHGSYDNSLSIASASAAATAATRSLAAAGMRAVNHDGANLYNGTGAIDADSIDFTWSAAPAYGYKIIMLAVEEGTVTDPPDDPDLPIADFTAEGAEGTGRVAVWFDASIANGNGETITSYAWDFGDGTTLTTTEPGPHLHIYEMPGDYDVALTVTTVAGSHTKTALAFVKIAEAQGVEWLIGQTPPKDVDGMAGNEVDEDGYHTHAARFLRLRLRALSADEMTAFVGGTADPEFAVVVYDVENQQLVIRQPDGTYRKIATAAYP